MEQHRNLIGYNSLISLQCTNGCMTASGLRGERLFLRSPVQSDEHEQPLPFFFFDQSVFRVVPTKNSIAAAERTGKFGGDVASSTIADVFNAQELTYGQSFSLVHMASELYVSLVYSPPAENDPDCMSVVLVSDTETSSIMSEFVFISRYKIRSEGDAIGANDDVLIRCASRPIYFHVSAPRSTSRSLAGSLSPVASHSLLSSKSGALGDGADSADYSRGTCSGATRWTSTEPANPEFRYEVNGCEEERISFVLRRYDVASAAADLQRAHQHIARAYVPCGVPIALYHREREVFLTTSATAPQSLQAVEVADGEDSDGLSAQQVEKYRRRRHRNNVNDVHTVASAEGQIHHAAVGDSGGSGSSSNRGSGGGSSSSSTSTSTTNTVSRTRGEGLPMDIFGFLDAGEREQVPFPVFAHATSDGSSAEVDASLSEKNCSCTSLWIVEAEDPMVGGPVQIGGNFRYRLRHACSGLYMGVCGSAVDEFFVDDDNISAGRLTNPSSEADSEAGDGGSPGDLHRSLSCSRATTSPAASRHDRLPSASSSVSYDLSGAAQRPARQTALCLIPAPRTTKDLERTLFTMEYLFSSETSFLIEQSCFTWRNALTGLYVCTNSAVSGPNIRISLQMEPSIADTIVASIVAQSTKIDIFFLHNQLTWLLYYRDQMLEAGRAKQRLVERRRTAAANGDAEAAKAIQSMEERREQAAAAAKQQQQRAKKKDADMALLLRKRLLYRKASATTSAATSSSQFDEDAIHPEYAHLERCIQLCQRSLSALIAFCSTMDKDGDILEDEGLPVHAHQRMLYDMQLYRLLMDVLLVPFTLLNLKSSGVATQPATSRGYRPQDAPAPSNRPHAVDGGDTPPLSSVPCLWSTNGSLPSLPLEKGLIDVHEVLLPIHGEIHLTCRLVVRLLRQMVRSNSSFTKGWVSCIPHFLAIQGYRLHVIETLKEMFSDNPNIPLPAFKKVADHFVQNSSLQRRAAYLDFLSTACIIGFRGLRDRQRYTCTKLLVNHPEFLAKFSVQHGQLWVLPLGEHEPVPYQQFFTSGSDNSKVRFVENQIGLFARLCFDGCPRSCREEVKKYFSREAVIIALRSMVWTGNERVGVRSQQDYLRAHLLRLALQCYLIEPISDPAVQLRVTTVLFGASKLRVKDSPFYSGQPDDALMQLLKQVTINLLRANPFFTQEDIGRSVLMRAVLSVWLRLVLNHQYTFAEIKEIIPIFLRLLDGTNDVVEVPRSSTAPSEALGFAAKLDERQKARFRLTPASKATMKVREMICKALLAALNGEIFRSADELIVYLHKLYSGELSSFTSSPQKMRPWEYASARKGSTALVVDEELEQGDERSALLRFSTSTSRAAADTAPRSSGDSDYSLTFAQHEDAGRGRADLVARGAKKLTKMATKLLKPTSGVPAGALSLHAADINAYLDFLTERCCSVFCPDYLVPRLIDITRYQSDDLTVHAMRLLVQLCVVKRVMSQKVLQVTALPSAVVIRNFDRTFGVAVELRRRLAANPMFSESWSHAIKLAVSTLLESFERQGSHAEASPGGARAESEQPDMFSSFALASRERKLLASSAEERHDSAETASFTDSLSSSSEGDAAATKAKADDAAAAAAKVRAARGPSNPRARQLWSKTANATRVLMHHQVIKKRRQAMGLSETSVVPLQLVVQAEIMAHWRIHETLLTMLPEIPASNATYFRLMKFFYLFTLSEHNAKLLRSSLSVFVNALGASAEAQALCLNIIVTILGTFKEVNAYLTTPLLTAFAERINEEVHSVAPDDEFVRLLSDSIFSKSTTNVVVRRRMMLILREKNTLRHLAKPRGNPSTIEVTFTSELVNLICNICGSYTSVLSLAQRILPPASICGIILDRAAACGVYENVPRKIMAASAATAEQSEVNAFRSGEFKLLNPYIRALVVLYFTSREDSAADRVFRGTEWTTNPQMWTILRFFTLSLKTCTCAMTTESEKDGTKRLSYIRRNRTLLLISIPIAVAGFFSNCFHYECYRNMRTELTPDLGELYEHATGFGECLLRRAEALNLSVEEMVNYRCMLGTLTRLGETLELAEVQVCLSRCSCCLDQMREWLAAQQESLEARLLTDKQRRDQLGLDGVDNENDEGAFQVLFTEESVSHRLQQGPSCANTASDANLLSFVLPNHRDVEITRSTLRQVLSGNTIIPAVDQEPSAVALTVNAVLMQMATQPGVRESVGRVLQAMKAQLFLPRVFVGLLNMMYNVVDMALRHSDVLEVDLDAASLVDDRPSISAVRVKPVTQRLREADATCTNESLALVHSLQVILNELSAMRIVTSLCAVESDVITYNALRLGVAILEGGNRKVQLSLLQYFETREESFFHDARDILRGNRRWIEHMNSEQDYYLMKRGILFAEDRFATFSLNAQLVEALMPARRHATREERMGLSGWARVRGARRLKVLSLLFRMVQLFCEGHLSEMQKYIRTQHDNLHSVSIVHETAAVLAELSVYVTPANFYAVYRGFNLLTETCQGPCHANQESLISADVCGVIRHILVFSASRTPPASSTVSESHPPLTVSAALELAASDTQHAELHDAINSLSEEEVGNLREAVSTTLLALIEGCRDRAVYQKVLVQLPLSVIDREISRLRPITFYRIIQDEQYESDPNSAALFSWLIFLYSIQPYAKESELAQIEATLQRCHALTHSVGSIEISREDGLEKVYFRIPQICSSLTQSRKDGLLWDVDRTSRATKLADFLHKSDELIFAVEQDHSFNRRIERWTRFTVVYDPDAPLAAQLRQHAAMLFNRFVSPVIFPHKLHAFERMSMVIAVLVNGLLMLSSEKKSARSIASERELFLIRLLCLAQVVVCALMFYIDVVVAFPVHLYTLFKNKQRYNVGKAKLNINMKEVYASLSTWECICGFLTWFNAQLRVFLLVMAISSYTTSPYFAAFNLMLIIYKIPTLRTFIAAITMNGKQLLLTSFLGVIILYIFSIFGFLLFSRDFSVDGESEGDENCKTLLRCFIYILNNGLRAGGGVGDAMLPWKWSDKDIFPRLNYNMLFYALVNVVFLNIMFGIIIDTFGQMRDDKREREQDMHSLCFICGLNADTLEKASVSGFQRHVKEEHNMWMYLYFMHHLRRKDPNDYTGQETYVYEKIHVNSLEFFPDRDSLSLINSNRLRGESGSSDSDSEAGPEETDLAVAMRDRVARQVGDRELLKEKNVAMSTLRGFVTIQEGLQGYLKEVNGATTQMRSVLQMMELAARGKGDQPAAGPGSTATGPERSTTISSLSKGARTLPPVRAGAASEHSETVSVPLSSHEPPGSREAFLQQQLRQNAEECARLHSKSQRQKAKLAKNEEELKRLRELLSQRQINETSQRTS